MHNKFLISICLLCSAYMVGFAMYTLMNQIDLSQKGGFVLITDFLSIISSALFFLLPFLWGVVSAIDYFKKGIQNDKNEPLPFWFLYCGITLCSVIICIDIFLLWHRFGDLTGVETGFDIFTLCFISAFLFSFSKDLYDRLHQ